MYSILHAANLVLLIVILVLVSRKKLNLSYKKQREELEGKIRTASAQYEEARAKYDALKKESDLLENKLSEMRRNSLKEIEYETNKIQTESERMIQMTIAEGETRVKNEAEKLRLSIEQEVLEQSVFLARKALEKEFATQDPEWINQMVAPENSAGKKNYAS